MKTPEFKTEADVKAAVKKLLVGAGWYYWMPPAAAYGRSGISDFHAIKDGVFLAIETKFGNNKPTPMQVQFLGHISAHGGRTLVINEKNLDDLVKLL